MHSTQYRPWYSKSFIKLLHVSEKGHWEKEENLVCIRKEKDFLTWQRYTRKLNGFVRLLRAQILTRPWSIKILGEEQNEIVIPEEKKKRNPIFSGSTTTKGQFSLFFFSPVSWMIVSHSRSACNRENKRGDWDSHPWFERKWRDHRVDEKWQAHRTGGK